MSFMRRLRVNAGKRHGHLLDMADDKVFDSSHFMGAQIISKHLSKRIRRLRKI